ncbi:MAG: CAP domain-containing protein [Methylobacterium sp.]|nr:CAP domain-containing protein [Methylobacterium sp.]
MHPLSAVDMNLRHIRSILAMTIVLALSGCGTPSILTEPANPTSAVILDERAAAAAISQYRARHGLGPVAVDTSLTRAAEAQARVNAQAGRLSHDLGGAFTSRMAAAGYGRAHAAENLGAGAATFEEALARWKASTEHNKNMLIPQLSRIGIARVDAPGSRYKRFWALVLASG